MSNPGNSNFILCSVLKRLNTYEYLVKVYYHSGNRFLANSHMIIEPQNIVVNGIAFKASNADEFFINTTLKNQRTLFTISFTYNETPVGDLFFLPTPKDLELPIDEVNLPIIEEYLNTELKQAG